MLFIALFSLETKLQSEFVFTADVFRGKVWNTACLPTPPLESVLEKGRFALGAQQDLMHSASSGPQRRAREFNSPLPLHTGSICRK